MGGRYLKRSVPQTSVWYASNQDPNSTVCCWPRPTVAVLDDASGLSQSLGLEGAPTAVLERNTPHSLARC